MKVSNKASLFSPIYLVTSLNVLLWSFICKGGIESNIFIIAGLKTVLIIQSATLRAVDLIFVLSTWKYCQHKAPTFGGYNHPQ